ncbi:hypothetical protein [Thermosulfurimonas sp. F29]|uniref:hypothetical protein n=1 Tax=Thermosulfurimonas sp. F29 TaxID=2867247 RepID=UPI001C83889D|nr:hypothetical protein [Thermosulfurimonas sp. F29]MBX6423798.1 hypothetical protein [Thermosulfurimonas sp. F29]
MKSNGIFTKTCFKASTENEISFEGGPSVSRETAEVKTVVEVEVEVEVVVEVEVPCAAERGEGIARWKIRREAEAEGGMRCSGRNPFPRAAHGWGDRRKAEEGD